MLDTEQIKKLLEKEKFEQVLNQIIECYINSKEEGIRAKCVTEFTQIGLKYPNIAPLIINLIKRQNEEDYEVLFTIFCDIIAKLPENFVVIVPNLIKELNNQSVYTRIKQTLELIRIKAPNQFIDVIMDSLKIKDDPDRWRYVLELGNFGVKFPEVNDILIPYLTKLLKNENEQIRAAATDTLEKIRTQAPVKPTVDPVPQIKAQANDESGIVRDVAKEALNNIEKVAKAEEIVEKTEDKEKKPSKKKSLIK
ncbi:MAG: HEAT repeat domain-containing protein [Candidatus Hodarchaeota archaeon]